METRAWALGLDQAAVPFCDSSTSVSVYDEHTFELSHPQLPIRGPSPQIPLYSNNPSFHLTKESLLAKHADEGSDCALGRFLITQLRSVSPVRVIASASP